MVTPSFAIRIGTDAPVAAAAIHDGHALRDDVRQAIALCDGERLKEEDPFTAQWADVVDTRLIGLRSRFEVDLNRPREKAVYQTPDDAWGLNVWRHTPTPELINASLAEYDAFYAAARVTFEQMRKQWGHFVVLDLHSYNHRRDGANAPAADERSNPEVNVGTGSMNRERWAPVVDCVVHHLRGTDVLGRSLDVRENVKFKGGHFSHWIHNNFPEDACSIALEFRKSFMDEWTGVPNAAHVGAIRDALGQLIPKLERALHQVGD